VKNISQAGAGKIEPVPELRPDAVTLQGTIAPCSIVPVYLRAEQVILLLPVSRRTLSNWQARRLIKFYRVGRTILFKRTDIEAALEQFAVMPLGTLRPRHRHVEDGNVTGESITPRKRRAGRIAAPANCTEPKP
jgi:excisionase family DNA binding protein